MPAKVPGDGDRFYCERYRCEMTRASCRRRQAMRIKMHLKGWRSMHSPEGKRILADVDLSPCNPSKCLQGQKNACRRGVDKR